MNTSDPYDFYLHIVTKSCKTLGVKPSRSSNTITTGGDFWFGAVDGAFLVFLGDSAHSTSFLGDCTFLGDISRFLGDCTSFLGEP